jgi:Mce-associated membrane protein
MMPDTEIAGPPAVLDTGDPAEFDTSPPNSVDDDATPSAAPARRRLLRPPSLRMHSSLHTVRLALVFGLTTLVALGVLCGWLGYQTHQARQAEQLRALMLQVGRQGAVNLTTIDYEHAEADVQRILDTATGQFYDDFQHRSAPFVDVVKSTQSKSIGTITEAGLVSSNDQEGQVLVAVSVKTTNRGNTDEQPRYWRMRLTVTKLGDEAKVSKVDFVP